MRPTLLVAEGDVALCHFYRQYLTQHGYDVETATNGLACLEKLRRGRPVVVVLDRDLRWGGGDGVLAWMREESESYGAPVVLMAPAGGLPAPGDDVGPPVVKLLAKPFELSDLLECVKAAAAAQGGLASEGLPVALRGRVVD